MRLVLLLADSIDSGHAHLDAVVAYAEEEPRQGKAGILCRPVVQLY